jgi:hypothetical protein
MAEVLQYASPLPRTRAEPLRSWGTVRKLFLLLLIEVGLAVLLAFCNIWLLSVIAWLLAAATVLATVGATLACLGRSSRAELTEAEKRTLVGDCARCGYHVDYLPSDRCPECGWIIPHREAILEWPDPQGPREACDVDTTPMVEAYLRAIMRFRPPNLSDRWNDDRERFALAAELAEAFRVGNELNSDHFVPEDSFAVATVSLGAHFAAMQILDRYLSDAFEKSVMAMLRTMTVGRVVELALSSRGSKRRSLTPNL